MANAKILIFSAGLIATLNSIAVAGNTYYVRPDGGSQAQCTGLVDAPYPGSGTAQACAWRHPYEALGIKGSTTTVQKITGGDTVIVANGSYPIGRIPGQYDTGTCLQQYSYDCTSLAIPSGPDAEHPTRIVGEDWQSGCVSKPELYAVERAYHILNLTNSSNVEAQCLELTDRKTCGFNYKRSFVDETDGGPDLACAKEGTAPYGDWGYYGIVSGTSVEPYNTSSNVLLKNLYIHGLGSTAIVASHLRDWTIESSKIDFNAGGGFNGDFAPAKGLNDEFSGTMTFRNSSISRNGCIEDWQNPGDINYVPDEGCFDQVNGGYGDGLGTGPMGSARWVFENMQVNYNMSDGIDLLYAEDYPGASVIVKNSRMEGNTGNQLKVQQDALVVNNEIIGNCDAYSGKPYEATDSIVCRGGGAAVVFTAVHGNKHYFVNNTITGTGPVMISGGWDVTRALGTEELWSYNNMFIGLPKYTDSTVGSDYYYLHDVTTDFLNNRFHAGYNIYYGTTIKRYEQCNKPGVKCDQNPLVYSADSSTDDFDMRISSALSPAINAGLAPGTVLVANDPVFGEISIPLVDRFSSVRSSLADMGMHEFGASPAAARRLFRNVRVGEVEP